MIKEKVYYTVVCDRCGVDVNEGEEVGAWDNDEFAWECAQENGWIEIGGGHYCEDCVEWDHSGEKLTVKPSKGMAIDTYLLQRAGFADNPGKGGIDKILDFEYMGSSEFEWGALPRSLKEIRSRKDQYLYQDYEIDGITFTLFAPDDIQRDFPGWIKDLINLKVRLKESSRIHVLYEDGEDFGPDFWWSLCDGFMFWVKNKSFEKEFRTLI